MFGVLGVFAKLAKWGLMAALAVVALALHAQWMVGVLIVAVVLLRFRQVHWKGIAQVLVGQLVEAEEGEVPNAAADALIRAGYEIGQRDAAFEIMREQAVGDPSRIRADRSR